MYPLGLVAELWCMWLVIPSVDHTRRLSIDLPNPANIAIDYGIFLRLLLIVQPLAWLQLYTSLWQQRRKKLTKDPKAE